MECKQKVVVIMGSTGVGKSRLSVDLATKLFKNVEIINCDKMQVYNGLDITTNKITMQERLGVPHHLLGAIDSTKSVFTPLDFRKLASKIISDVESRGRLPVVVGGSCSFIYSLVTKEYDPTLEVFNWPNVNPISSEFGYDCCFIWLDVCLPVLNRYLSKRVDEMMDGGMFEELAEHFGSGENERVNRLGLGQSIGVVEFETYFKRFTGLERVEKADAEEDVMGRTKAYNEAVGEIKENTYQLAKKQVSKIIRLRDAGWDIKRVDATEAFSVVMAESGGARFVETWEKQVVEPTVKMVKHFLDE